MFVTQELLHQPHLVRNQSEARARTGHTRRLLQDERIGERREAEIDAGQPERGRAYNESGQSCCDAPAIGFSARSEKAISCGTISVSFDSSSGSVSGSRPARLSPTPP